MEIRVFNLDGVAPGRTASAGDYGETRVGGGERRGSYLFPVNGHDLVRPDPPGSLDLNAVPHGAAQQGFSQR